MSEILKRILRNTSADLIEELANRLAPTDLQSLMIEVYRQRAAQIQPAGLLRQHDENRFVRPSLMSPLTRLAFEQIAFSVAQASFEPIELSPLSPLGTTSSLTTVSQNNAVATSRNSETTSDPTNVMALECALRRQKLGHSEGRMRLCCSQRVTRAQAISGPKSWAHFLLFALASSGRDEGSHRFEIEELAKHIDCHLSLFKSLRDSGYSLQKIRVAITDFEGRSDLFDSIQEKLEHWRDSIEFGFDPSRSTGTTYYNQLCFQIFVTDLEETEHFLVDGGVTDWTQTLLSNKKERFLISGLGSERLCSLFAPAS